MNVRSELFTPPRIDIDERLNTPNVFQTVFGNLDSDAWLSTLIRSIDEPVINGVQFPRFPPKEIQSLLHGDFGASSLNAAAEFYKYVASLGLTGASAHYYGSGFLLDFGSGWGRIIRMFMRDFPLRNTIGYEPNSRYCSVARACNPYLSFLNGDFLPNGILPRGLFNLVVSYSVFSHLSQYSAKIWLKELSQSTALDGRIVITTWGLRFLNRLKADREKIMLGEDIHWYSKFCINAAGDIDALIDRYLRGEFVWFASSQSELYGEAFLSETALRSLIKHHELPLEVEFYNDKTVVQDVFVIRKTGRV